MGGLMEDINKEVDKIVADKEYKIAAEELKIVSNNLRHSQASMFKELQDHAQAIDRICTFLIKAFGEKE